MCSWHFALTYNNAEIGADVITSAPLYIVEDCPLLEKIRRESFRSTDHPEDKKNKLLLGKASRGWGEVPW